MMTHTDHGLTRLDDSSTLHRAALHRCARQLDKIAGNPNAVPARAAICRRWASALWWLHAATDTDADQLIGPYANHLEHLLEWRIHWEASLDRPQIQAKRDRVIRLDQDLRAARWALATLGLEPAAA